jgi:hypothetical protein
MSSSLLLLPESHSIGIRRFLQATSENLKKLQIPEVALESEETADSRFQLNKI